MMRLRRFARAASPAETKEGGGLIYASTKKTFAQWIRRTDPSKASSGWPGWKRSGRGVSLVQLIQRPAHRGDTDHSASMAVLLTSSRSGFGEV